MKSICLFTVILTVQFSSASAQVINFEKTYGLGQKAGGADVLQQTGDYVVVGSALDTSTNNIRDAALWKVNANGDMLWNKLFGGSNPDNAKLIVQANNGGYIIAGVTQSIIGDIDIYLVHTDVNGNTIWTKTFGSSSTDFPEDLDTTMDGGYIITGTWNGWYICLIKIDENGDTLWIKVYPWRSDSGSENAYSVKSTPDGGYIMAGSFLDTTFFKLHSYLVKVDSLGDMLWTKVYFDTLNEEAKRVRLTADNGYIITGYRENADGNNDIYLMKTALDGDIIWFKTYDSSKDEHGNYVEQTEDRGYVIVGNSTNGVDTAYVYLIKTDSTGNTLWERFYGGTTWQSASGVHQTFDKGYVIAGFTTYDFVTGNSAAYLIKTDTSGCVYPNANFVADTENVYVADTIYFYDSSTVYFTPIVSWYWDFGDGNTSTQQNPYHIYTQADTFNVQLIVTTMAGCTDTVIKNNYIFVAAGIDKNHVLTNYRIQIFPNPFSDRATIRITNQKQITNYDFRMYDLLGREVYHSALRSPQSTINRGNLPRGMYFYKLTDKSKVLATGKIVIQ